MALTVSTRCKCKFFSGLGLSQRSFSRAQEGRVLDDRHAIIKDDVQDRDGCVFTIYFFEVAKHRAVRNGKKGLGLGLGRIGLHPNRANPSMFARLENLAKTHIPDSAPLPEPSTLNPKPCTLNPKP